MTIFRKSITLFSLLAGLLLANTAFATGSEIDFTSEVSGVSITDGVGTISVTIYGIGVDIIVNDGTEIGSNGEEIAAGDILPGDFVRIEAFFSIEGIAAEEIKVLDSDDEQFRIRGMVQAASTDSGTGITTITVLGIDITADADTDITRRASGNGNAVPATELIVGDKVNVAGKVVDGGSLYAVRIHVGNRQQGDIELEGVVDSIITTDSVITSIVVTIDGGPATKIIIDDNTYIGGELIPSAFVEVEGQLVEEDDGSLAILAFQVLVDEDGDGDADDDNRHGNNGNGNGNGNGNDDDDQTILEVKSGIILSSETLEINGSAEVKYEEEIDETEQKVEVEIEDGDANTEYTVVVFFGDTNGVVLGTLMTDSDGEGEAKFKSDDEDDNLSSLIPADKDVRDITAIEIKEGETVVLSGEF